jgi:hypothetical protein
MHCKIDDMKKIVMMKVIIFNNKKKFAKMKII